MARSLSHPFHSAPPFMPSGGDVTARPDPTSLGSLLGSLLGRQPGRQPAALAWPAQWRWVCNTMLVVYVGALARR